MAIKAVATLYFVNTDGVGGQFKCNVSVAGIVSGNLVDKTIEVAGVDPGISSLNLEAAIKQAVKDDLINNHSYTFGLFDSVRLVGALL